MPYTKPELLALLESRLPDNSIIDIEVSVNGPAENNSLVNPNSGRIIVPSFVETFDIQLSCKYTCN